MSPPSDTTQSAPTPPALPINCCLVGQKALVTAANSGIGQASFPGFATGG